MHTGGALLGWYSDNVYEWGSSIVAFGEYDWVFMMVFCNCIAPLVW